MKYFKLTYYLLFICIAATACSSDAQDIVDADRKKEDIRVQLTIQFPEAATRATNEGTELERMINNLHLYIFEANTTGTTYSYKEEASVIAMSNNNGSATRTILGLLSESYTRNVKIVALANLDNKGLDFTTLPTAKGTSLSVFYEKLIFSRTNTTQWPAKDESSLPMWGECNMEIPTIGNNNPGNLTLTRAISKVNVLVNNGNGITENPDFQITSIEVCQYNDRGYCTPGSDNTPNVPATATISTTSLVYSLDESEKYHCADRIYIPEQKNTVDDDLKKVFLRLAAKTNATGQIKEFIIPFKKDGTGNDFDVLRNNIYEFNITKVGLDVEVNITATYTVKPWEEIKIDVPPFGGE